MQIDPANLSSGECYKLLVASLVPRPIAWVMTRSAAGKPHLAPFSYFGAVTASPPTLMLGVDRRRGLPKVTTRNLLKTREAVVHIPDHTLAQVMVDSSAEAEPEVDQLAALGLHTVAGAAVSVPRLAAPKVAFECQLEQHLEVGSASSDVLLLRVVHFHLADEILVDGQPDPILLGAVARLGGNAYCDTRSAYDVSRRT